MVDHSPDEALAAVTAEDTRVDSLITLFSTTKKKLADALSGVTIPPAVQEKINSIFDLSAASAAKMDTALNTNVPPPPDVEVSGP
jgi:hypothetical protein